MFGKSKMLIFLGQYFQIMHIFCIMRNNGKFKKILAAIVVNDPHMLSPKMFKRVILKLSNEVRYQNIKEKRPRSLSCIRINLLYIALVPRIWSKNQLEIEISNLQLIYSIFSVYKNLS